MNTIAVTINLPTGSRNPQEYHNAVHEAIAAATARGDSMGAHALAGLLALMMPMQVESPFSQGGVVDMDRWSKVGAFIGCTGETIWPQTIDRGFRDPHRDTTHIRIEVSLPLYEVGREDPIEYIDTRCPRCYAQPYNCYCADPSKPAQE